MTRTKSVKPINLQYIVLCGSVVGSAGSFEIIYGFDGARFDDREDAIAHGFTLDRSDDFNIGVLQDGKLIGLDWMRQPVERNADRLREIQKGLPL